MQAISKSKNNITKVMNYETQSSSHQEYYGSYSTLNSVIYLYFDWIIETQTLNKMVRKIKGFCN